MHTTRLPNRDQNRMFMLWYFINIIITQCYHVLTNVLKIYRILLLVLIICSTLLDFSCTDEHNRTFFVFYLTLCVFIDSCKIIIWEPPIHFCLDIIYTNIIYASQIFSHLAFKLITLSLNLSVPFF